jgi:hypothetical protein
MATSVVDKTEREDDLPVHLRGVAYSTFETNDMAELLWMVLKVVDVFVV